MQASSSHQSCKAKQKGPATTCSELGCSHPLISTRILAHLRFRRSAVFSSTATNLPQESPNFLMRLLPQRCRGRPRILTQTRHRFPKSPSKQPTEGFHFSRQKLLPLKRLAPDCNTFSTSSANLNSRSRRFSLTFDSQRFPSKNQELFAHDPKEARLGRRSESPSQKPTRHLPNNSSFLSSASFSAFIQTTSRGAGQSRREEESLIILLLRA